MSIAAQTAREKSLQRTLHVLSQQLLRAAHDGDHLGMSNIDHKLRTALMAWVGAANLTDPDRPCRVDVLRDTLQTVHEATEVARASARSLEGKTAPAPGKLVYLKVAKPTKPQSPTKRGPNA